MNLRELLERARNVIAALAPHTAIKSDDAIVVVIDAALNDATMFGFLEQAVADDAAGRLSFSDVPPVALQPIVQELKIDWVRLLEAIPTIIALIKSLR